MGCSASRPNTLPNESAGQAKPSSSFSSAHISPSNFSVGVGRTLSLPTPIVHPPVCKGDSQHLVSLTSTTYGSLRLINSINPALDGQDSSDQYPSPPGIAKPSSTKTLPGIADAKGSLSPDSVINTWELMDGLDDFDLGMDSSAKPGKLINFMPIESPRKPRLAEFLNCDGSFDKLSNSLKSVEVSDFPKRAFTKPLWKHLSEESLLAKMDPNVASSYRQALSSRQLGYKQSKSVTPVKPSPLNSPVPCNNQSQLPGGENRIVLYCTSLRGIRKTYEDCCSVRMIFRGFGVAVDERDISMDSAYRKELQGVLGGKAVSLPQVFIRGKYVGGADEISQLHEFGELAQLLKGIPTRDPKLVCKSCGDARFIPCTNCNGSRKVFEEEEGRLRRCSVCNENGLVRCRECCS